MNRNFHDAEARVPRGLVSLMVELDEIRALNAQLKTREADVRAGYEAQLRDERKVTSEVRRELEIALVRSEARVGALAERLETLAIASRHGQLGRRPSGEPRSVRPDARGQVRDPEREPASQADVTGRGGGKPDLHASLGRALTALGGLRANARRALGRRLR